MKKKTAGMVMALLMGVGLSVLFFGCESDGGSGISLGMIKVEASPEAGFSWAYYLYVPNASASCTLLVEPNNTGFTDDNNAVHDEAARRRAEDGEPYAKALRSPLLVPTFPRPHRNWQVYTQALDRDTLQTRIPGLQRLDLQLLAMIEDARSRLSQHGINIDQQVFMMGFSASGMFVNRFCVLHPNRVKAAAIGSPGGWPIAPVDSWQGQALRYHVGVADLRQLTGAGFDRDAFSRIPLYLYMGDQDTNDSVPYGDSYSDQDRNLVNRLFGSTPVNRWPHAVDIYQSIGANAQFVLYPGAGHTITKKMQSDVISFFSAKR